MTIALVGYGKMGHEVERLARERGISIGSILKSRRSEPLSPDEKKSIDVAVHFAAGETVLKDVEYWSGLGKNIIIGTTGWNKDLDAVTSMVKKAETGLFYASNFSIGVNLLFRLVGQAAKVVNSLPEYDVALHEVHHKEKADSPSGTAFTIADILLKNMQRKRKIETGPIKGRISPDLIHVSSQRTGSVVGTHTITFDSEADSITLTHTAKNRSGFATGAILAAEWVRGKKGVFTMNDMFEDLLR